MKKKINPAYKHFTWTTEAPKKNDFGMWQTTIIKRFAPARNILAHVFGTTEQESKVRAEMIVKEHNNSLAI